MFYFISYSFPPPPRHHPPFSTCPPHPPHTAIHPTPLAVDQHLPPPLPPSPAPRFSTLPLPALCPIGFVFVWAPKQHIQALTSRLYAWGYMYVENLTWVHLHPSNRVVRDPSPYARRSHLTLLIFRVDSE